MTKELCVFDIPEHKEFAVHPEATHYSVRKRRIVFYGVNPKPSSRMKEIPEGSNTMKFPRYKENMHNVVYGSPEFRGHVFQ